MFPYRLVVRRKVLTLQTGVRFIMWEPKYRVRSTAGRQTLNLPIEVRILDPVPY